MQVTKHRPPYLQRNYFRRGNKIRFTLQEYTDKSCEWERDPKDAKTWAAWNLKYKRAYDMRQLLHQASYGESQFVSADAAMVTLPSAPLHYNVQFFNQPASAG